MTRALYDLTNLRPDEHRPRTMIRLPWTFDESSCFLSPYRIEGWVPPEVVVEHEGRGRPLDDVPGTTWGTPVVSERAALILEALCGDCLQFLPLRCVDKGGSPMTCIYSLMVILKTVDSLDYRRSIRNDGISWSPQFLVIHLARIPPGPFIFRTQGMRTFAILDEPVREALLRVKITGATLWNVRLSTDEDAPPEVDVPESAIEQYRTQWQRLPRYVPPSSD